MASAWYEVGRALRALLQGTSKKRAATGRSAKSPSTLRPSAQPNSQHNSSGYDESSPGQFGDGRTRDLSKSEIKQIHFEYAPDPDGDPDPGEIVWTWVPYVENDGRGKDRPVLIIGRISETVVVGCYLSTKQHRGFVSIGAGAWDSQGRESFLSPERLLRVTHTGMRREGVQIDRDGFNTAVSAVRRVNGL